MRIVISSGVLRHWLSQYTRLRRFFVFLYFIFLFLDLIDTMDALQCWDLRDRLWYPRDRDGHRNGDRGGQQLLVYEYEACKEKS